MRKIEEPRQLERAFESIKYIHGLTNLACKGLRASRSDAERLSHIEAFFTELSRPKEALAASLRHFEEVSR